MSKNAISASLIVLALALWLASGYEGNGHTEAAQAQGDNVQPTSPATQTTVLDNSESRVRVELALSEPRTRHVVLRGRTESKRIVEVKAELAGTIVSRPVERGFTVEKGDLLCELAVDDRVVAMTEARAALQTAQIEHQGSLKLKEQGLLSDVTIANSQARLESAQANLHRQELNLAKTRIVAPFAGVVEELQMNIGDYAIPGASCATLIDLNPMLIVAQVTENEVDNLNQEQAVSGLTSNGRILEGAISFVGKQSNPNTRTYPVEVVVDNEDYSIRSGLTVSLRVGVESVTAHHVAPSLLTLDDHGQLGLRYVDDSNKVVFRPVTIIEDSAEGMWVTGLPSTVNLITVGQEYVAIGDIVEPVFSGKSADQVATL